ncbi:hypothetical protein C4C84_16480 [Salmonella enterica]|nr:hypothetical protein [Salmonella enterica]EBO8644105.1 hypothetical protein [Salmonella enterica subsp. enterica serovar Derby]
MITGNGINTVTVNGKVKHITELDDITLCLEWTKLREENNRLYEINNQANRGWRGFILRLIVTGSFKPSGLFPPALQK